MILSTLPHGVSEKVMYSSVDAGTYRDVGNWLMGGDSTLFSEIRPFGYPLFLKLSDALGGAFLVWLLQFLMWLTTVNLVFLTAKALFEKKHLPWISAGIVLTNFSLMALTLHAVTEVMSAMMLAGFIYFVSKYYQKRNQLFFIHGVLFWFSLMVIVKPVFSIPLYAVLFCLLPIFYGRAYLRKPVMLLMIPCVLLPFLIQVGIMSINYNTLKVSRISENTFAAYFLAQGVEKIESLEWTAAQEKATSMSPEAQKEYLLEHLSHYMSNFIGNVEDNIKGAPIFLTYPLDYEKKATGQYMELLNKTVLVVHYIMIVSMAAMLFVFFRKKSGNDLLILLIMGGLTVYYLLATGVSFWQGDRLVISVLPVWSVLYPWLVVKIIGLLRPSQSSLD